LRYGETWSPKARRVAVAVAASAFVALAVTDAKVSRAKAQSASAEAIKGRHADTARSRATSLPRSEHDQAVIDGWPLYRTARGQAAFNDTMATLKATDVASPSAQAFAGCSNLECALTLPKIGLDGWLPAGRIWVSPTQYVLIAHSERPNTRRRMPQAMRVFVFHEFHNSSRNTDTFDTISSHSGSVFVPLYMSKPMTDARGRSFVMVVQIAPYDVVSIHASNMGSSGPGIEVARNTSDAIEPLQNLAGVVVAQMIKTAAPHLRVVNHRGSEGQPMLSAYERHIAMLRARTNTSAVALPFTPAAPQRLASATGARIDDLMLRRGQSPRIPVAERGIVPRQTATLTVPTPMAVPRPDATYGTDADRATALVPALTAEPQRARRPALR
jgi:hypothetical protein